MVTIEQKLEDYFIIANNHIDKKLDKGREKIIDFCKHL